MTRKPSGKIVYDYIDERYFSEDYEYDGDLDLAYQTPFADPGGRSSLRAASARNPRIHPCPNCERENTLTTADVALGYQCDACADEIERGGPF